MFCNLIFRIINILQGQYLYKIFKNGWAGFGGQNLIFTIELDKKALLNKMGTGGGSRYQKCRVV